MESNNTGQSLQQGIQALWSAEKMLTETMPLMVEKASHVGLKKNLALHLAETRQHKAALELMAKQLGFEHGDINTDMKTILDEGQKVIASKTSAEDIDAAIIAGAKQIEKYEMSMYQKLGDEAKAAGLEGVNKRLQLTFEEERQANTKMNFLEKELVYKTSVIGVPE